MRPKAINGPSGAERRQQLEYMTFIMIGLGLPVVTDPGVAFSVNKTDSWNPLAVDASLGACPPCRGFVFPRQGSVGKWILGKIGAAHPS